MSLNNVTFQLGQGGLGRKLPTDDHVSALLLDEPTPAAYGSNFAKSYRSLAQIEADAIIDTDPTYALVHYTAKEFFRMNPQGELYLVFNAPSLDAIIAVTEGRVRQFGIYKTISFIGDAQSIAIELSAKQAPASFIIGLFPSTPIVLASLPDLRAETANYVSIVIAGDGTNEGAQLATDLGLDYVPALGAVLGAISRAAVHQDIAWVQEFNFALNTQELETPVMADGTLLSAMLLADLEDLDSKGYLFFCKFVGRTGSYINDSHCAIELASDYAYIENNRVIGKAQRLSYLALLPQLNAPVYVDTTGKLAASTIGFFKGLCDNAIVEMAKAGEISAFETIIDPAQNVLSTSRVEIAIKLVPVGVAREILVKMSFALSVNA
jgi:hypothetical protein